MLRGNHVSNTGLIEDRMAHLGREAGKIKAAVADRVEDSITNTKRAVRRARVRAEDLLDDAAHEVRQRPLGTVAAAFGAGAIAGLLAMSLNRRRCAKCKEPV